MGLAGIIMTMLGIGYTVNEIRNVFVNAGLEKKRIDLAMKEIDARSKGEERAMTSKLEMSNTMMKEAKAMRTEDRDFMREDRRQERDLARSQMAFESGMSDKHQMAMLQMQLLGNAMERGRSLRVRPGERIPMTRLLGIED